jgi:hypothetical protein
MNKRFILSIAFLTISVIKLNAQQITPEKLGFIAYSTVDKSLGEIDYYISSR